MLVLNQAALLEAITDNGISQRELSRITGISARLIGEMIHRPIYFIRLKTLSKIKKALHCGLGTLIKGDWNRNEIKRHTDDA